jgi:hypothetical protein
LLQGAIYLLPLVFHLPLKAIHVLLMLFAVTETRQVLSEQAMPPGSVYALLIPTCGGVGLCPVWLLSHVALIFSVNSPSCHASALGASASTLFTGVRGIGILRTSPFGDSRKFLSANSLCPAAHTFPDTRSMVPPLANYWRGCRASPLRHPSGGKERWACKR